MKIGVVGAGFIARALASLAIDHGHEVMISNSRGPQTLGSAATALRCRKGEVAEAVAFGDVVIIAVPFSAIRSLDPRPFVGKVVLDANNYYPDRDGRFPELDAHQDTTSGLVARHLEGAKVIKFFNAILQEDILPDARPRGAADRRALPLAGNDEAAKRIASDLQDQFGFDPVDAGSLADSWRFERAMPAYCRRLNVQELNEALAAAERGVEVPHGSWRRGGKPPAVPAQAEGAQSHRGSFAGRGELDIVDAQFHLSPQQDARASLAAMDALGIRSAVLDELWGYDADGLPVPHARLKDGAYRALSPLATAAALQHPGRFAFLQRVSRKDPMASQFIALSAATPGCRSLRVTLHSEDERARFANGEWDEILAAAQRHELPVSVLAEDAGRVLLRPAQRFAGLQFIIDHCGWGKTPSQWNDVLGLAKLPNAALKWSHARKAFRRFDDPAAAQQREFVRALEAFGSDRVLWAGDASYEESSASWSELLGFVRDNPALSEGDKAMILAGAARRVFRWAA